VASVAELDAAEDQAKRSEAERQAATGDLGVATQQRVALDALLARQGKADGAALVLSAPIDGVVLRRSQDSAVPVGAGQVLLEFGRPDDLEIVVEALSQDAVKLAPGMAARVERWGGEGALAAKVKRVEPAGFTKVSALGVEEQRTLVRLDLDEPIERWSRLGDAYRVEVTFVIDAADDALTVPSGALLRDGEGWAVYRVDAGRARRTPVTLGVRASDAVQVLSGLAEGDRVVGHPDDRLHDGLGVRDDG
jgi:HlyD family secretion protein